MFLLQGNPQWRRTLCQNVKVYPMTNKRYVVILQFSKLVRVFFIKVFRKKKEFVFVLVCGKILILAIFRSDFTFVYYMSAPTQLIENVCCVIFFSCGRNFFVCCFATKTVCCIVLKAHFFAISP